MKIKPFQALLCPIDDVSLVQAGEVWKCENGHSFDIAKHGYTHLLPVQNKRSLDPGDHKEMIAARRRYLNAGHYLPIASAVNEAVVSYHHDKNSVSCLDAGCGEGFYLRQLMEVESTQTLEVLGVDISKWAVLSAAKQAKKNDRVQGNWIVASNANLPVESNSVDCVLCMFGFPVYSEFARVLKPEGLLLQVDAASDHLKELRDIIYPNQKQENPEVKTVDGFYEFASSNVCYGLRLEKADEIADLLAMTPHLYRAKAEGLEKAAALKELNVTVDVRITQYKKTKKTEVQLNG